MDAVEDRVERRPEGLILTLVGNFLVGGLLAELLAVVGDAVAGLFFELLEDLVERGVGDVERHRGSFDRLLGDAIADFAGDAREPNLHLLRHLVVWFGEEIDERFARRGLLVLEAELDQLLLGGVPIGGVGGVELFDQLLNLRGGGGLVGGLEGQGVKAASSIAA